MFNSLTLFIENHPETLILTLVVIGYILFIFVVWGFIAGAKDRDIRNALDDLKGKE